MANMERSKRVLVVDDEKDIGFLMTVILKAEGYDVEFVRTLKDARTVLEAGAFDTVFLDLNLDNEYGLDLIPDLQKQDNQPTIVIITAQKEPQVREEIKASDVDFLIEKPFNKSKILKVLRNPQ